MVRLVPTMNQTASRYVLLVFRRQPPKEQPLLNDAMRLGTDMKYSLLPASTQPLRRISPSPSCGALRGSSAATSHAASSTACRSAGDNRGLADVTRPRFGTMSGDPG